MKYKLVVSVLMAALLVAACGGGNSTTGPSYVPSSAPNGTQSVPASSTFCFVDDMTQPLVTATVGLTSGEIVAVVNDGCISLPAGASLAYAEAPGFRRLTDFPLTREDVALPEGTFALWPTAGYLEQLEMYDGTYSNIGIEFGGIRPKSGMYTVALPNEMFGTNSADMSAYQNALDALLLDAASQSSNKVVFQTTTSASANIKIVVDAGMSWTGYFTPTVSGRYITGGTLMVRSLDILINDPEVIRHELGHFLGVNHTLDSPHRLMYRGSDDDAYATEAEVTHFRMRFFRSPGFDARKG